MATTDPAECTVTDLSNLAEHSLNASSQAATNTVSTSTAMTAPGSQSESTASETVGDPALHATPYNGRQLEHGDGPSHLGDGAVRTWNAIRRGQ